MFTLYFIFFISYCLHHIKFQFSFSQNIYQHQIQIQMHKNNQILNGKKSIKSINQFNIHIQNQDQMHKNNKTIFTIIYAFQSIQSIQYTYSKSNK